MLNTEKIKKEKKLTKDPKGQGNGPFESQVLDALSAIGQKLGEHDEQIAEFGQQRQSKGEALLRMVNLCYDPDDKKLPGLTRLPLNAVHPFAIGRTLNAITSEEVRSGKKSLVDVFYNSYFLLMRSVGGDAFNKGVQLASEQAAAEAEESGAEFRAGEE